MNNNQRPPVAFRIIVALTVAPLLLWPMLLSDMPTYDETLHALVACLPAYVLLSGYIAYQSYGERREVSWILISVAWISYAALAWLATSGWAETVTR